MNVELMIRWENSVGGVETEEARHTGEHMEGDNRGAVDSHVETPEEIRHLGARQASPAREYSAIEGHEESRNLQRPLHGEPFSGVGKAEEGGVAESGRAQQAGGGIHQEVQWRDEVAEAGVSQPVYGDDRPWLALEVELSNIISFGIDGKFECDWGRKSFYFWKYIDRENTACCEEGVSKSLICLFRNIFGYGL